MRTYIVTNAHARAAGGAGNRRNAKAFETAVRELAVVQSPKTGGKVDTSPLRVARQYRDNVRKLIRTAVADGYLSEDQALAALHMLKLAKVQAVANIVEATGAFTFPIPGLGAVVMEGEVGAVGKLTTAGERTERRMADAVATMRGRALEQARADVKLIEAA